jgi:hypothetical protein
MWSFRALNYLLRQHQPRLRLDAYREANTKTFEQSWIPESLALQLSDTSLRISLFYRYLLEPILWKPLSRPLKVLDIGCKNWTYASGLASWLNARSEASVELTGLECDPGRRYLNLFRRGDVGRSHAQWAEESFERIHLAYRSGDWLKTEVQSYDLLFCFFPFIFRDLHQKWGLPDEMFRPKEFYAKCLRQSPLMIFAHQGDEELLESKSLVAQVGGHIRQEYQIDENPYLKRKHRVWMLAWSGEPQTNIQNP